MEGEMRLPNVIYLDVVHHMLEIFIKGYFV